MKNLYKKWGNARFFGTANELISLNLTTTDLEGMVRMGDRICPACEQETLVEKGLTTWKCLNSSCKEEFETEYLDADLEEMYEN